MGNRRVRLAIGMGGLALLAGCANTDGANVVAVDDAFDGMVTDVMRFDTAWPFIPLALGPDGSVAGVRQVYRGPLTSPRGDLIIIEPGGLVTVVLAGLGEDDYPLTASLSESTIAWITLKEADQEELDGDGVVIDETSSEKDYGLFASSRSEPSVVELTNEVRDAGGSLRIYGHGLHVIGDTVIGASSGYGEVTFFSASIDGHVNVLATDDVFALGGYDGCATGEWTRFLNWRTGASGGVEWWQVARTTVPVQGPIEVVNKDLRYRNTSSHHHLPIAACGDIVWHMVRFGEEFQIAWRNASDPSESASHPMPIKHAADLWASPGYIVGAELTGESFVMRADTGEAVSNRGGWWCNTVDVQGELIMWRDGSDEGDWTDGSSMFACPTYVGRLVSVDK